MHANMNYMVWGTRLHAVGKQMSRFLFLSLSSSQFFCFFLSDVPTESDPQSCHLENRPSHRSWLCTFEKNLVFFGWLGVGALKQCRDSGTAVVQCPCMSKSFEFKSIKSSVSGEIPCAWHRQSVLTLSIALERESEGEKEKEREKVYVL